MIRFLNTAAGKFFDLVYPQSCFSCGKKLEHHKRFYLCEECKGLIGLIRRPVCPVCGYPGFRGVCPACAPGVYKFDSARAHAIYDGILSEGIKLFKYGGKTYLSATFGRMLASCLKSSYNPETIDLIVPVPLAGARQRQRGFNQSELIAVELGRIIKRNVSRANLRRMKNNTPQTSLARESRPRNVEGIFRASRKEELAGRNILLVDDVFTTGSTVNECAKALKAAGSGNVNVVTLARTRQNLRTEP